MAESGRITSVKNSSGDVVPGRKGQILCQPCSRKDLQTKADVFCSNCVEFQCSDCSKAHTVYTFMKNHELVNATEVKAKPPSFDMKGMDGCNQHGELLKFFCEDENQLCCCSCAIIDHRKCHSVVEVTKIAEKSRSVDSQLKRTLEEIKSKAEKVVNDTKSSKTQLKQDINAIFINIKRMRADVNKMFDDLEVYITRETEIFQTEISKKLTKKQSNCEKHIADVTNSLEIVDAALQNGTPSQKFIVEQKMKTQVDELCSNVEKACQKLETFVVSFAFDETLKLPPNSISNFVPGKLTLNYTPSEVKQSVASVDPTINLTKIKSIDLKQTGDDVKVPVYLGIDFLPDGRLVAVDNNNMKCLIFNEKLEEVGSYQLSQWPQGVVAVSGEEVAITSAGSYKIYFLHVSKSNEITLNRTCNVQTKYDSICLKDDEHFVACAVDDRRHVRIVSLTGEESDLNLDFPNKKYPYKTSASTYIKNSDKAVVTDIYDNTVYIYDIATNTREVIKDEQIKSPRGVAVGPHGYIFVCSKNTQSVVQISQTGRVLSSCKLDMRYPYRVCVSKDQSILAVTSNGYDKNKLQLFRLTVSE